MLLGHIAESCVNGMLMSLGSFGPVETEDGCSLWQSLEYHEYGV